MFAIRSWPISALVISPIFLLYATLQPAFSDELVHFESKSDNSYYSATLDAYLERPTGPGPFPAVVLMHGCAGLTGASRRGMDDYSRDLVSRGFVTLVVDSFDLRKKAEGSVCAS